MRDPAGLVTRSGIRANTDVGQHFLIDERVLDRIPAYAQEVDAPLDTVLEVGAGAGGLTDRLLTVADEVIAIERDPALVGFLREEFSAEIEEDRLAVVAGDALTVPIPPFTACISNLPYGISSEVTFRLLPRGAPLVLMFQLEFAERMVAEPATPSYGRLSVSTQHFASAEIVERVPRTAFDPQPAVDSAIVRLLPRPAPYDVGDETFFLDLVKAVFTQRRKTLRNAIRNTGHISGIDEPEAVIERVDADLLDQRPEEIPPATFAEVAELGRRYGVDGR